MEVIDCVHYNIDYSTDDERGLRVFIKHKKHIHEITSYAKVLCYDVSLHQIHSANVEYLCKLRDMPTQQVYL